MELLGIPMRNIYAVEHIKFFRDDNEIPKKYIYSTVNREEGKRRTLYLYAW